MATFSTQKIEGLAKEIYGIDTTASALVGYEDLNFLLKKKEDGKRFVFKVYHAGESWDSLDGQDKMLHHLSSQKLTLNLPEVIPNSGDEFTSTIKDEAGNKRYIRLLTWVEGRLYAKINPHTTSLRESMGQALGKLCSGLIGFDHPAAHRKLNWDNAQVSWVKEKFHLIEAGAHRELAEYFYGLIEKEAFPKLDNLRKSVLQNDANDYNIIVSKNLENPIVTGVFDFGDFVFSPTINELAIAIAYAAMGQPNPLMAAAEVVKGCHSTFPLEEIELEVLYHQIATRLLISVTSSAIGRHENPDNKYIQVSEKPAWDLLKKWKEVPPSLAHFTFRKACGMEPCPISKNWQSMAASWQATFPVDLGGHDIQWLDLSVGSLDLGGHDNFSTNEKFEKTIGNLLDGKIGLGGYGEVRPFYSTDAYQVTGNNGPCWRTVHLGLDVWAPAGTHILAPLDGVVFSIKNNKGERDYGPTIFLKHEVDGFEFFTLYGHLSLASLEKIKVGQKVEKDEAFAEIGPAPENGNWPPHLHFQILLDQLGMEGDFPGVAFPDEREVWMSVCPNPIDLFPHLCQDSHKSNPELLPRRRKHLASNLSLSYQQPLTMLRGKGQYLFDKTGRRYLDTVNNVAHVGHEHPAVVRAASRQNAVLNTNTRYLHPNILEFAERLLATFPEKLDVAFFVNSGSEANELALRISRTVTGRHEVLAMEHGYHGNTGACVDISQYKFDGKGGMGKPDWLELIPSNHEPQFSNLEKACFIHETILSCAGQVVLPDGFLKKTYAEVRSKGGLCIADEVQTGVGRMGDFWWAFETQGVVPDIVTIGKPIGNGHPLAAVVTTREIADAFANGMEYFNTFGGNPVSCAIGSEVLKVVEEEGLRQNAFEMGNYLMNGLRNLAKSFPIIADVRGHGLFLGYELKHPKTGEAVAPQTAYLANRLREMGILASTDGQLHNVIKIKPPMIFNQSNADFLLASTEQVFGEDFMQV